MTIRWVNMKFYQSKLFNALKYIVLFMAYGEIKYS